MTLLDEVRKFIKQYQLINTQDKILIGLSGGPDSVCLLYALNALKEEFSLKLYIGHLNHSLRGRESDQDQEFALGDAVQLLLVIPEKRDVLLGQRPEEVRPERGT